MRYAKVLGFTAVAVAVLMSFVGSGTASATVLCKTVPTKGSPETEGTTCPEGWALKEGEKLHAVLDPGVHADLTDGEGHVVVTCRESTVESKVAIEGSATATTKGNVELLTFSKCTSPLFGETNCTVATGNGGTLEAHWETDTFNATLTSNSATVTTNCQSIFGAIHCAYITENSDIGRLTGGATATMDIESIPLKQETTSALCPEKPKWDAKYRITTPDALYAADET